MPDKEYPSVRERAENASDELNLPTQEWRSLRPHTTLIHACYRVEQYLPDFFATLDAQTADHRGYELVFVVDGSPDRSAELIRAWAASTDYPVRLIVQSNQGVAAARNAGLSVARGEWISSPDPDDSLAPDYLRLIEDAREAFPAEDMVVARIQLRSPDGRDIQHPLDFKFANPDRRIIDLAAYPEYIQPQGGTVFMRRAPIIADGITFNTRLPAASDSDFIMRFLLLTRARYVYVPAAQYDYQRRADDSSIVKTQEANVERYRVVFGETHPALLDLAGDECPSWLANSLLYFVYYLFRRNRQASSPVYTTPGETLTMLREHLTRNLARVGASNIRAFHIFDVPIEIRMAWLAAAEGAITRTPVEVILRRGDGAVSRVAWYETPTAPIELSATSGTVRCEAKQRGVEFLGAHWVTQRVARVSPDSRGDAQFESPDSLRVELEPDGLARDPAEIRRELGQQRPPRLIAASSGPTVSPSFAARVRSVLRPRRRAARARLALAIRLARVTGLTRRLAGAAVMTAAPGSSDSECAALFVAVANACPKLEIWYVADPESATYSQLSAAGLRVVARGSKRHFVLLKCADRVWVPNIDRAAQLTSEPFAEDVLAVTWQIGYLGLRPPGPYEYRAWNAVQAELLVAESDEEFRLLTGNGGNFRFLPSEVTIALGWRDLLVSAGATESSDRAKQLATALVG